MEIKDILGIHPVSEAVNLTVKKSLGGAEAFLQKVCSPALEELGLFFRDGVRVWRVRNAIRIIEKAEGKMALNGETCEIQAHPKVILAIIEQGSLNDDEELQDLWSGLFASSCAGGKNDDQNLIFIDLLKKLTALEAKILKFACEKASKYTHGNGLLQAGEVSLDGAALMELTNVNDMQRLDRELDHMRNLGLISGGFHVGATLVADVTPTPLSLHLYARVSGKNLCPAKFWQASPLESGTKVNTPEVVY